MDGPSSRFRPTPVMGRVSSRKTPTIRHPGQFREGRAQPRFGGGLSVVSVIAVNAACAFPTMGDGRSCSLTSTRHHE